MMHLPDDATQRVRRIEALLDEADAMLARGGTTDEAGFALRETRARYLPDTIRAYQDVPPSLRSERDASGRSPDELFAAQLDHLERATAQRLRELASHSTDTIAANGAFLTERFGAAASLPQAEPVVTSSAPPQTLVRSFLDGIHRDAGGKPASLVAVAAERFNAIVPQLLSVQRGGFGLGGVEGLSLEVPVQNGAMRFALTARRSGIEATCAKVVRGIALRTEAFDLDEWLQGLYEVLGTYVERDRHTRDTLTRFLEQ
jgi:hypothetical protein